MIDVNVHDDVERLFLNLGAVVYSAKRDIAQDAPDDVIDEFARRRGCIIVSHDRRFMQLIQRRLYDIPASTGYGRILLCGNERRQALRLQEVLSLLVLYRTWTVDTDRRFLAAIADNWIRFDDKPIARVV